MGAKIQAFDIFQTPLSSHYPLPLSQTSEASESQNRVLDAQNGALEAQNGGSLDQ